MEWMCIVWRSLCVLLVVFALNLDVIASQDYYKYDTDNIEFRQNIHEFKSLDEEIHHIKRRSASDTLPIADSSTTSPIIYNTINEQSSNETTKNNHMTEMKTRAHMYYNSSLFTDADFASHYWVDMKSNNSDFKMNAMLSKSYRRAETIKLSFDFPFYGHLIRNVTVATGGFIYTGDHIHTWLAATQYIAPLMANFDNRLSNESFIKYVDNGTSFTVQWENVVLQDKPEDGEFTFQTTLFDNGDIVFVYRKIPVVIENITDDQHPVKVGLADAYLFDRPFFAVRRRTIFEYHRINFKREDIKNDTVIYLQAQPTCLNLTDCQSCMSSTINNFNCKWCPLANRCSAGLDRHRQDWLMKECDRKQFNNESQCKQADKIDFAIHDNGNNQYNFDPNKYDHEHGYRSTKT